MTLDLTRRLLASGAVAPRDIEAALYLCVVRGVSLARALVDRGVLGERALEEELERRAGPPLRQVSPASELVDKLPRGMCRMLAAIPVRFDAASGVTEVAAVDPQDGHVASELSFHLGTPVRVQRATMASIEEAIRRLELADGSAISRSRRRTPAFPHGAPESVPPAPPGRRLTPEELPIPLVRRVGTPSQPGAEERLGASEAAPSPEEPPRPEPSQPRRLQLASVPDLEAVSFPSAPPPTLDDADAIAAYAALATGPGAPPVIEPPGAAAEPPAEAPPGALAAEVAASSPPATPSAPAPASLPVGEEEPTPIDDVAPAIDGPEPITIPRAPDAGWSPTLPELLDLIGRARARDELLDLVLRAVTLVAQRGAVFVVRREGFTGWSCNPAFGSEEDLKRVVLPTSQPSIFATSAATGFYLGPIPRTPVHAGLLSVLQSPSSDVAVYVAKVKGRPTVVLLADRLDDTLLGTRALGEIAKRAGEALTGLLTGR